jgi:hypothetical protein
VEGYRPGQCGSIQSIGIAQRPTIQQVPVANRRRALYPVPGGHYKRIDKRVAGILRAPFPPTGWLIFRARDVARSQWTRLRCCRSNMKADEVYAIWGAGAESEWSQGPKPTLFARRGGYIEVKDADALRTVDTRMPVPGAAPDIALNRGICRDGDTVQWGVAARPARAIARCLCTNGRVNTPASYARKRSGT